MNFLKAFFVFSIAVLFFSQSSVARAIESSDYLVTPVVFDKKAKARDILKESITVRNTSNHRIDLYPSVYDIDVKEGAEEFISAQGSNDRKESLANWIELSRGVVELGPGEEISIPFVIRVNFNALPGSYHAVLSFSEGSTRSSAEDTGVAATATVNLEVASDSKETLQLNRFFSDTFFFSGDDVLFNFQLENIGNKDLQPKGDIRIYDRKGQEVATVTINEDGRVITPGEQTQLASVWSAANGFGKYKAFLNIEYGTNQKAAVQDTGFFWIVPWKQLLGLFTGMLIVVILFALYFHRWVEQRHLGKLALAGAINIHLVPQAGRFFWQGKQVKPIQSMQEVLDAPVAQGKAHEKRRGVFSFLNLKSIFSKLFMFRKRKIKKPIAHEETERETSVPSRSLRHALGTDPEEKFERAQVSSQLARDAYSGSTGGTINLKQFSQQKSEHHQTGVSHVINLKNRS